MKRQRSDRLFDGARDVALLQRDPLDRHASAGGDVGGDRVRGERRGQARVPQMRAEALHHLSRTYVIALADLGRRGGRLRRLLAERVDALAAHVHAARVRRIVDADAGGLEVGHQRDELQAEQRHDADRAAELGEPRVHLLVVEVGDADRSGTLRARTFHDVFRGAECREVRRYVDVGVDDRCGHGSS